METYKVRITKQAKKHLILIRDYIATGLQQPSIAKELVALIRSEMYALEYMPHRIKCIDEQPWKDLGFRKIRIKNYYVYFWISENEKEVVIIAVVYVKMDQLKQLEKL